MGLLRDKDSELPMLQRLVARLQDASRRHELSPEDWSTAMVAYALDKSEDPALFRESAPLYEDFVQCVEPALREQALDQLAMFVRRRQGKGWQALLFFALGESADSHLCARAATFAIMNAPAAQDDPFPGASCLVSLLANEAASPAMLGALLALPELRFLPLLQPLYSLPHPRLQSLLAGVDTMLNALNAEFLLRLLEAASPLAEDIVSTLLRMAAKTTLVADVALPMPTWAYSRPTPQPLHAWSLPEYLPRMLPRLQPHLNSAQIERLRAAFV